MGKSFSSYLPKNLRRCSPTLFEFCRSAKNGDFFAFFAFLLRRNTGLSVLQRTRLLWSFFWISVRVESPHTNRDILAFVCAMLRNRCVPGSYVECGCYKGSSTAKFSLVASLLGKKLFVFDSFAGIPENDEEHGFNIYGERTAFKKGDFAGGEREVRDNIRRYGALETCELVKGWFEETLPAFHETVSAAYLDVDLESSTKTCLKYLYPLLDRSGIIMSQDGHLPLVIRVFSDQDWWVSVLGTGAPTVAGLGTSKIISFVKKG
jgi:O-methyltransferase